MHKDIIEINNFLSEESINKIYNIALEATDEEWDLMNDEELNGIFWNGKRMMFDPRDSFELQNKIKEYTQDGFWVTTCNKLQRFYKDDVLGPLVDYDHGNNMTKGFVLFLHDDYSGGGIEFPDLNYVIPTKKNKMVIYDSKIKYKIMGPNNETKQHFITVFENKQ